MNASYYVAHFDTSSPVADPEQVVFKLNHMLPGDIEMCIRDSPVSIGESTGYGIPQAGRQVAVLRNFGTIDYDLSLIHI